MSSQITCEFCNQSFKSRQSKCNHRKICKAKPSDIYDLYNQQHPDMNITFGNENLKDIRDAQGIDERYREAAKTFSSLLDLLYFNASRKENQTVRKKTKKSSMVEFRQGNDAWIAEDVKTAIPKLLTQVHTNLLYIFSDHSLVLCVPKTNNVLELLHNRTIRGPIAEETILSSFDMPPIRTDHATWTRFVDAALHRFYHEHASWMTRDLFEGYKETIVRELKEVACGEYGIENFTMYRDGLAIYNHLLSLHNSLKERRRD